MRFRSLILTVALMSFVTLTGCRSEPAAVGDSTFPTRVTYSISPKSLFDKVHAAVLSPAVNLKIEHEGDGRISTDWVSEQGARMTVAGVGRTWQERTRYTITVTPSWDDPANKSSIEVTEESQQRPHDRYAWDTQETIKRPDRAAHMAALIDAELRRMGK